MYCRPGLPERRCSTIRTSRRSDIKYDSWAPVGGLAALSTNIQQIVAQLSACLTDPGAKANRKPFSAHFDDLSSPQLTAMAAAYDGAPDAFSGIQAATALVRADMAKLESSIQFNTLNWFTYEEHADDCSALINYQMDVTTATALSDALGALALGVGGDSNELKTCQASAASIVPPIGSLDDPRHGICFRLSNLARLAASIQANQAGFASMASDFLAKSIPPGGFPSP